MSTDKYRIIVSYGARVNGVFPDYEMIGFPKTWVKDGFESAMKSQPEWQTNNSYFYGPKEDFKNAMASIVNLFDRYNKTGHISRYVIRTEKISPYRIRRSKL